MRARVRFRAGARVPGNLAAAEDEVRDEHGRREAGHGAPGDERAAVAQALGHGHGALAAHAVGRSIRALPACERWFELRLPLGSESGSKL